MNKNLFVAAVLTALALQSLMGRVSAFELPDTGQATCYDGSGTPISCIGTGQDGEYLRNRMSYTDNGDGTVTDNNTGLMWQQTDDGNTYNWYEASGTDNTTYNPAFLDVCGSLDLAGYSDWRLPTKRELMSIEDFSVAINSGPMIDTTAFPNGRASAYWASTISVNDPTQAFDVVFHDGQAATKIMYKPVIYNWFPYVRCVRDGE